MSHIVKVVTQVRDAVAVHAGCKRLGLDAPVEGKFQLFGESVTGLGVRLREWRYPVVLISRPVSPSSTTMAVPGQAGTAE